MASYKSTAARDLPLDREQRWDAEAAERRIFAWAWPDGKAPADGGNARRAFLLHNADTPTDPAGYLLPFADVVDGRLVAVTGGLADCARQVPGIELSAEQAESVEVTLNAYTERLHEENETDEQRDAAGIMLARTPLERRAAKQPASRDELPEELFQQIHDPSVLENGLPYLNAAWGSTDLVDTYHTRMLPSTLQNFADDSSAGISIQNSHRNNELGLGRTYLGKYTARRGATPGRSVMDFYIPPNLQVTELNTNSVIDGIKWGTLKDVSVGFYGGELRCSIDQKPMLRNLFFLMFFGGDDDDRDQIDTDGPCNHLPGVEYWKRDKDGKKLNEREVAIGEIDGAHLAELSIVFDGATPQAQIKGRQAPVMAKATRMMEMGVLSRRSAMALETQYRSRGVRLPDLSDLTTRRWAGFTSRNTDTPPHLLPMHRADQVYTVPPKKGDVLTKSEAGYVDKGPFGCKNCSWFEGGDSGSGKCAVIGGTVSANGCCDEWNEDDAPKDQGKQKAEYVEVKGANYTCGECRFFDANKNTCWPVEGSIDEKASCNKWMPHEEDRAQAVVAVRSHEEAAATTAASAEGDPPAHTTTPKEAASVPEPNEAAAEGAATTTGAATAPPAGSGGGEVASRTANPSSSPTAGSDDPIAGVRAALVSAGLAPEGFQGDLATRFRELGVELTELRGWSDIGHAARTELVERCKKAGVRAFGTNGLPEAAYGPILTRGSYQELQDLLGHLNDLGAQRFPGGRKTEDGKDDPAPQERSAANVPDLAFRS